jgi:hypothetical protein
MESTAHPNAPIEPSNQGPDTRPHVPTEEETVKLWRNRIREAKRFFEKDFQRMRENMEFAAGLQWEGQLTMDDSQGRYMANFLTKHVNDKVANLYAKNPKCEAQMRKRLNYQIWDGTLESEQSALGAVQIAGQMGAAGMPVPPEALKAVQLLQDIQQGKQLEDMLKKVGNTLEILYEYQCDQQQPSFKEQMKDQLVARAVTCGVGFVRLDYVDEFANIISPTTTDDSFAVREKMARSIMAGMADDKIQSDDPRIEQLRELLASIQQSMQDGDLTNVEEHLEFSFPSATAIIVDTKCSSLKGFQGAKWVAQEHIMSLEDANAYFELTGDDAITPGGDFVIYTTDGTEIQQGQAVNQPRDFQKSPLGCFWEVFDLTTKSKFWIADGWRWYVQQAAPVEPATSRFWPIFPLVFNHVVVEPGQKASIYPPSDIQILKPIQKERNRVRDELKKHREVNRPFFGALANTLEPDDIDKMANHETGELVQFKKVPMNNNGQENVEGAIWKWEGTPIDKNVYDTSPLEQDASLSVGANQIQQGLPIRHVAATPAVIQEQARMQGNSSNVDDLDDLLSELAKAGGEMLLRAFKPETVQRVVGPGAAWPTEQKEDFLNGIYLDIQAASSGRPNKAVDIQNAQQLVPLILQSGGNPVKVIEYLVKVLDANLRPADFFPVAPPVLGAPGSTPQGGQPAGSSGAPTNPQRQPPHPGVTGQQSGGQAPPPGVQQGGQH